MPNRVESTRSARHSSGGMAPHEENWSEGMDPGLVPDWARGLRILHIGNVANNAYRNATLLNEAGLDCDVICYDYYHLMGSPEWEDADIDGVIHDHFYPNWSSVNLHGFRRPRWFAQGPMETCLRYLLARRRRQRVSAHLWWLKMEMQRRWLSMVRMPLGRSPALVRVVRVLRGLPGRVASSVAAWIRARPRLRAIARTVRRTFWPTPVGVSGLPTPVPVGDEFAMRAQELVREFHQVFPHRTDQLTLQDMEGLRPHYAQWKLLLAEYDIVQGYSTDPIFPLLCGKRPYVGFEHGTLREIPFDSTAQGRMTALSYALADGVFITNGDCLASVPKLHIRNAAPMLHAVDERKFDQIGRAVEDWHVRYGVRYLFLCPLRHDWKIKGTDVYLRALPMLAQALRRDCRLLVTAWGNEVEASKQLIRELGVEDLVVWLDPIPRRRLVEIQKSIDVVFDQIALPCFGGTAPDAIAAGVPVLMSYDPRSTDWIVSEPAPILTAWSVEDVVRQTLQALHPDWRAEYRSRARRWTREQHSYRRVVAGHIDMYKKIREAPGASALG